jgi:hypothetical protein
MKRETLAACPKALIFGASSTNALSPVDALSAFRSVKGVGPQRLPGLSSLRRGLLELAILPFELIESASALGRYPWMPGDSDAR